MYKTKIPEVIEDMMVLPNIKSIISSSINWTDHLCSLLNLIPVVGGVFASEIQAIRENVTQYQAQEFFRNLTAFIIGVSDLNLDKRRKFLMDIENAAEDSSGNVIMRLIDSLDNINKQKILSNLVKARANNQITIESFFRLSSSLERIPYVDIKKLPLYLEDFYDDEGDSEMLFSTGILIQTVIDDQKGNKYRLSKIGVMLLQYGLKIDVAVNHPIGTKVANMITYKPMVDISDMYDNKLDERINSVVDKHLEEKDYIESNQAMFEYDVVRGK